MKSDDYALAIIGEGQRRGISARGIQIALATALVESGLVMYANEADPESLNYPHDALSYDGTSVGLFQQQNFPEWGTCACRMSAACSAGTFYEHLVAFDYNSDEQSPGSYAQKVQRSAFPDRYDDLFDTAVALYNRLTKGNPPMPDATNRPDFNEYGVWSTNCQPRQGTLIDLWLIHTEEGGMNADALAHWMQGAGVSYHYTISQADDGGVTVCDVVDTDQASWSVLDANNRSINLCFAGSFSNWTREQWLEQSRAIDVAAYLCAQDCRQYGIAPKVIAPPYDSDPPGVSDHKYVTEYLGVGNHTDVGDNFPWDVFAAALAKYTNL